METATGTLEAEPAIAMNSDCGTQSHSPHWKVSRSAYSLDEPALEHTIQPGPRPATALDGSGRWKFRAIIALSAVTLIGCAWMGYPFVRDLGRPTWKLELGKIAANVIPVDKPGAIPREQKEMLHRCNADILQRESWTQQECDELFAIMDGGLKAMKRSPEDSNEHAWARMSANAPMHAMEARFHYGAPVDPAVAERIHTRYIELMRVDDYHLRMAAVSGAIYGYMDSNPKVREMILKLQNDEEPLIANMTRRYAAEIKSAEWVRKRAEKFAHRGY